MCHRSWGNSVLKNKTNRSYQQGSAYALYQRYRVLQLLFFQNIYKTALTRLAMGVRPNGRFNNFNKKYLRH